MIFLDVTPEYFHEWAKHVEDVYQVGEQMTPENFECPYVRPADLDKGLKSRLYIRTEKEMNAVQKSLDSFKRTGVYVSKFFIEK